ncbi:fatty acid desaturase [Arenibacterium sp. CAU 1754]
MTSETSSTGTPEQARDWVKILAQYREPNLARSLFELAVSLVPFLALWALALWVITFSPLLALLIAIVNGGFLLRLFIIQHDCGHGGYFNNKFLREWTGRVLGVLTLTPYDVWRRSHSIHHASTGNLSQRGMGDITTLTVEEYRNRSWFQRLLYRVYRSPIILFGIGPAYMFLLQHRLPIGHMRSGKTYWISAMGSNLALAAILGVLVYFGGIMPLLMIFLPTVLVGASAGVWLFYVQHQFEETHWEHEPDWQLHDAALHGSSHYVLPRVLQWITGNIGVHHVHHLYSRIPFYRLTEVLRDYPVLSETQRLTIRESLACVKFHLWDEKQRKLISIAKARALYGPIQRAAT